MNTASDRSKLRLDVGGETALSEVVLGLHWDPPEEGTSSAPDDLDALCILFDKAHKILEVIHPGYPRNANSSVVHTGDSKTGASTWDDERIFVFLEALPDTVCAVSFVVLSAQGRALGAVRRACCHISDRSTENELLRLDLESVRENAAICVATLERQDAGWAFDAHEPMMDGQVLNDVLARVSNLKKADIQHHR